MIIRQDWLGIVKERRNDKRAGTADRTHLPPHRRSMVNSIGVVGVAQLVERRSVAPNVAGSSPVSHPNPSRLKTKPLSIFPCSEVGRFFAQPLHTSLRGPPVKLNFLAVFRGAVLLRHRNRS